MAENRPGPAAKPLMWVLRSTPESDGPARTFRIATGATRTLGRAVRADFILEAAMVSRVHCRLSVSPDGQLEVVDLGSTNGTFVNDRRVERAVLVAGDRLRLGRAELRVERHA